MPRTSPPARRETERAREFRVSPLNQAIVELRPRVTVPAEQSAALAHRPVGPNGVAFQAHQILAGREHSLGSGWLHGGQTRIRQHERRGAASIHDLVRDPVNRQPVVRIRHGANGASPRADGVANLADGGTVNLTRAETVHIS